MLRKINLNNISNTKIVLLIFLLAFILRLAFAIYSYNNNVMANFADDRMYWDYAEAIIEKGPFVLDNKPLVVQFAGPFLPSIMALMILLFGSSWLPIFILNAIIGSLTCVLIYLIGEKIFDKRVGFLAAIWSIFYVLFLKYVPTGGKEVWMIFFLTLLIFLLVKLVDKKKFIIPSIFTGIIFSLLIHHDERYFAYFPIFFIFIILLDKINWKIGFKKALVFVIVVLILMIPWLVRNYIVYERPVILTIRTTVLTDKLMGYEPLPEIENSSLKTDFRYRWFINSTQIDSVISNGTNVKMASGKLISDEQVKAMQVGILPKPISKFALYWSSFNNLWQPIDLKRSFYHTGYRYDGKWSFRHNFSSGLTYGILIPFFIIGLIIIIKKQRNLGLFFLSIIIMHTLIHVLFIPFSTYRYRLPIDPLIIVLAFYGVLYIVEKFRSKLILGVNIE